MKTGRSVRSYQREIRALKHMIASMLWVQPGYNGSPSCSYCGEQQHLHATPCAAVKLVEATWPDDAEVRLSAVRRG